MTTSKELMDAIGTGMRLFVPFDGSQCLLIDGIAYWHGSKLTPRPAVVVDRSTAEQSIGSGLLLKMEEGTAKLDDSEYRIGWRESGLAEYGTRGDIYAMVQ